MGRGMRAPEGDGRPLPAVASPHPVDLLGVRPVRTAAVLILAVGLMTVGAVWSQVAARAATASATDRTPAHLIASLHSLPLIRPDGKTPFIESPLDGVRSVNWGGYAVNAGRGTFTSAKATFVAPGLTSCGSTENSESSFWVGIDGYASNTVEQDGIDAVCYDGTAEYLAWYETYPADPHLLADVTVSRGDTIVAAVTQGTHGSYRLVVTDQTSHTAQAVTVALPAGYVATDSSAECIAEDPGNTPVPYAHYGVASFTSCSANGTPIGRLAPTAITTVTNSGTTEAVPGPLRGDTAFTVTRQAQPSPAATAGTAPAPLAKPVVGIASTPSGTGYWLANAQGAVSAHGSAKLYGSLAGRRLNAAITHIVATSDGKGYWLVASDGGIFAFGDAAFLGSMGGKHLNAPVVDMAATPNGKGYWLVGSDGGIFAFGNAVYHGSMGGHRLNRPVVAMSVDTVTGGYWLVGSDGGIFAFDAPFAGSAGSLHLAKPVVSMASAPSGKGYWLVGSDGGIFAFGAPYHGSKAGQPIPSPVVGVAGDNTTGGYWLAGSSGAVYNFGAPSYGSD